MEPGSITRPASAPPPASPQRVEAPAQAGAARTDLPPERSAQQSDAVEAVRFEPSKGVEARAALEAAVQDVIQRNVVIDPKSREIVFQSVDRRTGEVVRQVPEEALLKLRAYAREMRAADSSEHDGTARVEKIA